MKLTVNMRLLSQARYMFSAELVYMTDFAAWLLIIENDNINEDSSMITLSFSKSTNDEYS